MNRAESITADDLMEAMSAAGVLEVFCHLPTAAQDEFSSWIGKARDDASHWRRIEALLEAMKRSPLRSDDLRQPRSPMDVLG